MTVQKILSQQIANTGGVAGQVLIANSTGITWGDANNATNLGGVSANSYARTNLNNLTTTSINQSLIPSANNTYDLGTPSLRWNKLYIAANTIELGNASISSNGSSVLLPAGSQIGGTNIAVTTDIGTSTANNSNYLGGVAAASYVNTSAAYTITGVHTHNANIVIGTSAGISANGSYGTANQVLTSTGTGVYWANVASSGGSGGFSNGQSISVNNFVVSGTVTANGSAGAAGQTLVSNGAGVNWSSLVPSYNYSAQFNGSSYLTTPNSSNFQFGTGAFTVEAWVYFSAATTGITSRIVGLGIGAYDASTVAAWAVNIIGTTAIAFYRYDGTTETNLSQAYTFSLNTWYHIVAVRNASSTLSYFINGTRIYTNASATTSYNAINGDPVYIGAQKDGGGGSNTFKYLNGYISNVRIVKGTAVYDPTLTTLTVPTSPLSAISGTSLLTCSALTLTDSSSFNNVITNNGAVVASATSNPPFTYSSVSIPTTSLTSLRQSFTGDGSTTVFNIAGGYTPGTLSVYYNGLMLRNGSDVTATNGATITMAIAPQSGALIDVVGTVPTTYSSITPQGYSVQFNGSNYLSVADSAALQPGSSNFTVEAWIYPTAFGGSNGGTIISKANTSSLGPYLLSFSSGGQVSALVSTNGSAWAVNFAGPNVLSLNAWYHVALVRNSNTIYLYINGVPAGSAAISGAVYAASGLALMIGNGNYATATFTGYISNARVVIGTAVYTGPFFPTGPLTSVQSATSTIGAITGTQTALLTCNAPTIIDGSTNAFTITNNGTATVSTAIVPTFTNVSITSPSTPSMTYGVSSATAITVNTATPTAICSVTITTKGKPVLIVATGDGNPLQASGWHILQIYRDGSAIGKSIINENAGGASCNGPFALTHIDVPAAGSHTYEVRAWQGSGSFLYGESGDSQAPNIAVVELL